MAIFNSYVKLPEGITLQPPEYEQFWTINMALAARKGSPTEI